MTGSLLITFLTTDKSLIPLYLIFSGLSNSNPKIHPQSRQALETTVDAFFIIWPFESSGINTTPPEAKSLPCFMFVLPHFSHFLSIETPLVFN